MYLFNIKYRTYDDNACSDTSCLNIFVDVSVDWKISLDIL